MTLSNPDNRSPFPAVAPKLDGELRASGLSVILTVHEAGKMSLAFVPIEDAQDQDFPSDVIHTIAERFRGDPAFRHGMTAYLTHVGAVYVAASPAAEPVQGEPSIGPALTNVVKLMRSTRVDVPDVVA